MKKKVFFKLFVFALFTSAIVVGVNINLNNNVNISDLALTNIEILAQSEGGGGGGCNTQDCPGGCCARTDVFGNNCSACCPSGKDPSCDSFGCRCR